MKPTSHLLRLDRLQGRGLGTELLRRLVQVGRDEGLARIVATIDTENLEMQHVARKVGFRLHYEEDQVVKAELSLA